MPRSSEAFSDANDKNQVDKEEVKMMKVRQLRSFAGFMFFFLVFGTFAFSQSLSLEKLIFSPGEEISVSFNALASYADNAWVGIIPSSVAHGSEATNDQNDLTYQYLRKKTSGTLLFSAPKQNGSYDFRMNDNDANGKEVASISFTVGNTALILTSTSFRPGESITLQFNTSSALPDNAWIGIIPSSVPHGSEAVNDQNDIAYQYLKKQASGSLTFTAPDKSGNYDFRLNDTDSNGKELASVSFTVGAMQAGGSAELTLGITAVTAGSKITVSFTAPANLPDNAWIGIIPSSVPHGNEAVNDQNDIAYQYLQGKTSGAMTFTAPTVPGSYDFRMHDTDSNGKEIASISFTVQ
jgi:hypothetical protein